MDSENRELRSIFLFKTLSISTCSMIMNYTQNTLPLKAMVIVGPIQKLDLFEMEMVIISKHFGTLLNRLRSKETNIYFTSNQFLT